MNAVVKIKPDWLDVLRRECDRSSQGRVATRLGVSPTMINQALKGSYPSKKGLSRLRALVEGAYMGATVDCPVIGTIARDICIEHQGRPFAATNPQRVRLYRACRGCTHKEEA